jgi:hypothetical protein
MVPLVWSTLATDRMPLSELRPERIRWARGTIRRVGTIARRYAPPPALKERLC